MPSEDWKKDIKRRLFNGEITNSEYIKLFYGTERQYEKWLKKTGGVSVHADPAAKKTDDILAGLEKRIQNEFGIATKEAESKWKKYMDSFDVADKKEAARLDAGEITKKEYQAWRERHLAQGKHWEEMKDVIAKDYHNANLIAARMTNDTMADVYALNANYGTYMLEHGAKIDTGFTLYNHDSAEALLKEQWSISPEKGENSFLPKPSAKKAAKLADAKKENPDILWNKQKIQSVMMQGVLSGEPLTALAERLAGVAQMDANQAIRNARTMTTNVQSKGRMDSFDRAAKLGVDLMDEWNSILDGATRHSHRHMHGERKPHDSKKPFSNGCRWPGDPSGPAAEVYNCRCRIISWVKGFEGNTVKENPDMGGLSFDEWLNAKAPKNKKHSLTTAPQSFNVNPRAFDNVKGIDRNIKQQAVSVLDASKQDEVKRVFSQYADRLVVQDDKVSGGAYFQSYGKRGVYFNALIAMAGNNLHNPMQVFFHESGHMIDWLANGKKTRYLSGTSNSKGITLNRVLKEDYARFKKSMGAKTDKELINMLKAEKMSKRVSGNISDILEGLSGIDYPLGVGHGFAYYQGDKHATEKEFFAEVLDSAAANEESYKQMQRIFPNAVDWVWNRLREVQP